MNIYDCIDLWATSIQADTTIQTYCVSNFGKGLLVQVDDDVENPLTSEDQPFCLIFGTDAGDASPVNEGRIQTARIVIGVVPTGTQSTPTVTNTRDATTNGLRKYGSANLAVDLMDSIIEEIKGVTLTGNCSLITTASYDVDGLLLFPLAICATNITVQETRDLGTF